MPSYVLAVTRTTFYVIDAPEPGAVWEEYTDLDNSPDGVDNYDGHAVYAADENGDAKGTALCIKDRPVLLINDDIDPCPACGASWPPWAPAPA